MAEQRSAFRFRLPWRQAAQTAPRSTATQPPTRGPTGVPQSRATPESQAASQAAAATTTSDIPAPENQNSNASQATAAATAAAQRPPFRPAGIAPVPGSSSPAQASRTEPKLSSSPSRAGGAQSQVSQPSSTPSHSSSQSRPTTLSSSPNRKALPQSPSRLASRGTAGETSSSTSPSRTADGTQPTPEKIPQPSSLPSSKPTETPFPGPDKESQSPPKTDTQPETASDESKLETPFLVPDKESQSPPKKDTQPETASDESKLETPFPVPDKESQSPPKKDTQPETASDEAKLQQAEMEMQRSKESETTPAIDLTEGRETPKPSQNSDIMTNNQESKPSMDSNLDEAKEFIQETGEKDHDEAKQEAKDRQPAVAFHQTENEQKDNQEQSIKEHTVKTSNPNGQQTKTTVNDSQTKHAMKDSSISKTAVGGKKQSMDEMPINVITLAGENRGASMQLGLNSSKKERPIHIHRGYKSNPDDENVQPTNNGEGNSSGERKSGDGKTIRDQEVKAYVNCNIQGTNNSILFNASITETNPGVNLEIPLVPTEHVKSNGEMGSVQTRKAEYNATPAQKLRYHEPTIKRRCLKGLFLESSDSDNPGKPRRHGCRVGCNKVDI